ncbi:DUF4331 domain-containing protein [Lysobacter sp. Root690]|uniref:DUF4331 domain-containing protein n=1 Tax=Lysobacter sp. Root690 TaxID=1736588 RepID=UPI0006F3DBB7|nr:DUF4331 domain-containing protein [Lysobacter sp. Root690]KRB04254.1 hypothetical protein ASD86_18175 [Lysobacter sp. Root690]
MSDPLRFPLLRRRVAAGLSAIGLFAILAGQTAGASDHLDSPSVIADPRADIGDLYAWMAPDGRHLNLVMTIVGHSFSDKLDYVFHIDSAKRFGKAGQTIRIACRFAAPERADCRLGQLDSALGDASDEQGLWSRDRRFRVFAGLRDDPFFNNVKGTRAAYNVADAALKRGAAVDAAHCPQFDRATSDAIFEQWKHTDGGPAHNLLAGWTPASIVIQVDLDAVDSGGKLLAVWAATQSPERQIDRAGRTLTGNALLGTLDSEEVSDALKERYNAATPATGTPFVAEIEKSLGLYDGFDGRCGNQWLARRASQSSTPYRALAELLADDRLWINSAAKVCAQPFAVELARFDPRKAWRRDCGGRTPNVGAINVYRSLLVDGSTERVDDGVERDDKIHSISQFPFLAPADKAGYPR